MSEFPHPDSPPAKVSSSITNIWYENGGSARIMDGRISFIKYNTGDKIWLTFNSGKYKVVRVQTHDGHEWSDAKLIDYDNP
jgi:hypothetical protein